MTNLAAHYFAPFCASAPVAAPCRTSFATVAATLLATTLAGAQEAPPPPGQMIAIAGDERIDLPLLYSDYDARIAGDMATVTVRQVFRNPGDLPLNATYLFPLQKDAAVYAMRMEVGDDIIEAVIQQKAQAQKTFEKARAEGKAASLLEQNRPNMFTQQIANLMPDLPVTVTLNYTQTVPRVDGAYELVMPLVVGPRYLNGTDPDPVPAYPNTAGLDLPADAVDERAAIRATLTAPARIGRVWSETHQIAVTGSNDRKLITLPQGRIPDNRDFVLRYSLAGDTTTAGVLTHTDERGRFLSLSIEPPRIAPTQPAQARELVFVLDTSGSMQGAPMTASRAFMDHALGGLRDTDFFRIIRFSDTASAYAAQAQRATPDATRDAAAFVQSLDAGGGTEIPNAIRTAFSSRPPGDALRIVVFLSDGYIGNEAEVLKTIAAMKGDARIYAFGVGTSVNRYLLDEMARIGRGMVRYIDPTETGLDAARSFATRIETPVLTDISVDWGGLDVADVTPDAIPDLFAGAALRLNARVRAAGGATVTIRGKANGRDIDLPIPVSFSAGDTPATQAVPLIWARSRIADLMRAQALDPATDARADVTRLGLAFSLATRWTSFVAVSRRVVTTDPGAARNADVALSRASGVPASAYPQAVAGSSTPEPGMIAGATLMGLILAHRMRRRKPTT